MADSQGAGGTIAVAMVLLLLYAWGQDGSGGARDTESAAHGCRVVFSDDGPRLSGGTVRTGAWVECGSRPRTMNVTVALYRDGGQTASKVAGVPASVDRAVRVGARCSPGEWQTRVTASGTRGTETVNLHRRDRTLRISSGQCPD
ncbi:hypothetical protein [Streptomyces sp. NPDC005438]|uniref:hypothetical protein n=1 Tax=Streptomyces sp. NPDC005438 TaxID=3156880 RepID=UPI0033B3ABC5